MKIVYLEDCLVAFEVFKTDKQCNLKKRKNTLHV